MKKMIIPALFLLSATTMANVADLNYQPKQGTFHLESEIDYSKSNITQDDSATEVDLDGKTSSLNASIVYGIMDQLSAGISLSYDLIDTTEADGYETTKENGMADPVIRLSYRATNQDPVTADFYFNGLISTGEKEDDAKKGGHVATIGAQLSKKMDRLELMADFSVDYNFESKDKEETYTTTYDPSVDFLLELSAQYQLTELLYLNGGLAYGMLGEIESKDTDNDTSTSDQHGYYGATIGAKIAPTKDLAFGVSFNYAKILNYDYKSVVSNVETNYEFKDMSLTGVVFSAAYSF